MDRNNDDVNHMVLCKAILTPFGPLASGFRDYEIEVKKTQGYFQLIASRTVKDEGEEWVKADGTRD
jgi:hypothetical protein